MKFALGSNVVLNLRGKEMRASVVKDAGGGDFIIKTAGGAILAVSGDDMTAVEPTPEPTPEPTYTFEELDAMLKPDIVAIAKEMGVDHKGTKADIIERLV